MTRKLLFCAAFAAASVFPHTLYADTNPVATASITNADCNSLDGWTTEGDKWASQGSTKTNSESGIFARGFIERWITSSSSLADGRCYQDLAGLPNGTYTLQADIIAVSQKVPTKGTGVYLFAGKTDGTGIVKTECGTLNEPERYSIEVDVTDGTLRVGVYTEGTTANWMGMDNFRLFRKGDIVAGTDMTGMLFDPGFDTGNGWLKGSADLGISNSECEAYQKTFDQYQLLTDLPNGKYTVKAQAFQRLGSNSSAYTNYKAGEGTITTFLYANAKEQAVKNIYDFSMTTKADNDYEAEGVFYPNSMAGAAVYFAEGLYENEVSAIVTDGTLRVGITCKDKSDGYWTLFDNFRLTYNGIDYSEAVAELKTDVDKLATVAMNGSALKAMLSTCKTAQADATEANFEALGKAIAVAKASAAAYVPLTDKLAWAAACVDGAENVSIEAMFAFSESYGVINEKHAEGLYADDEIPAAVAALTDIVTTCLVADASLNNPRNLTCLVANNDLKNGRTGWTIANDGGNVGDGYECVEFWNSNSFDISQTVADMPAGTYKLVVKGFYRFGGYTETYQTTEHNAKAYLGTTDNTVDVKGIEDGALSDEAIAELGITPGTAWNSDACLLNNMYIPNTMNGAAKFFAAEGNTRYDSEVYYTLETAGDLLIGANKNVYKASDWTIFKNFSLYYLGTGNCTKTIPASGYVSFSAPVSMSVPADVTVCKAAVNGDKVVLTAVESTVIPANTGVMLYSSAAGEKTLQMTATASTGDFTGNELIATSVVSQATVPSTGTYYGLKAGAAEFAKLANGMVLSAGKAYLAAPADAAKTLQVIFDGETTGISALRGQDGTDTGAFYTIQGVKVASPAKGLYIRNGKKEIIK